MIKFEVNCNLVSYLQSVIRYTEESKIMNISTFELKNKFLKDFFTS